MLSKKYSIHVVLLVWLLIIAIPNDVFGQTDTLILNESAMDETVRYSAKDSIYTDFNKKQVHLYNEAIVDYGAVHMTAGYIMIDLESNEVLATYMYDKDSNRTQMPVFTDGSEEIKASSIRYNFNTKKGYIQEVAIQQDENFLYMEVAKRHANEEVHFLKGRFTTCDLEEPHYHFQLSKAVLIPEKRIVSGPMNLWVRGVPTPLGLPFIVIPQVDEDKTRGLIFPRIVPLSNFGFGFDELGYYLPINDRVQTTFYGSLYSRGSWGIRNMTDYAKRYKFGGRIDVSFQQFNNGFPEYDKLNKFSINWTHLTDAKSSPYWEFNSSVMFMSDNNAKNNLDPLNPNIFSNTFNSDINLNRLFPGKPITMGLKVGLKQNSTSGNIALSSPVLNINMTRVMPFKNTFIKQNALSRLGLIYSFEGQNRSTFADTLLSQGDFQRIGDQFQNGLKQNVQLQTTISLLKNTLKITPSVNYNNQINFQQIRKEIDTATTNVIIDTLDQFGMAHALSFSAQATTALYSYYRTVGKNKPIMRHVLTPRIGFSYTPKINKTYMDSTGTLSYSPFERSLYTSSIQNTQGRMTFGVSNTLELKRKSEKDTITGFKKTRLIDAFTIDGSYDFLAKERPLSDLRVNIRVSPMNWINIVVTSNFSPYGWNEKTGADTSAYATRINGKLGRFTSSNFATTLTLTSKESREKLKSQLDLIGEHWNADYEYYLLHPEHAINFGIPWKVSFSHVYTLNLNGDTASYASQRWDQIQTVMMQGDVSITKRWKIATTINFDLKEAMVTNARVSLTRDMHCWALAFHWVPIGTNQSFLFSLRSTSSLFKDAKIELKKPPAFL